MVFALGIRFVGEIAAKALARHFKSMDALASASLEDMLQINGIGVVIAESVIRYFANEANRDLVRRLREKGVRMELSDEELSSHSDKLSGQSIVVSGVFSLHSRDEYKAMIEQHGGKKVWAASLRRLLSCWPEPTWDRPNWRKPVNWVSLSSRKKSS